MDIYAIVIIAWLVQAGLFVYFFHAMVCENNALRHRCMDLVKHLNQACRMRDHYKGRLAESAELLPPTIDEFMDNMKTLEIRVPR